MWEYYKYPCLLSLSFVVVLIAVLRKQLRKRCKIKVNCWFCNEDTHVPYDQLNSFLCPTCKQYNGFGKDGDYNKAIPEQHDEMLNKQPKFLAQSDCSFSNGLCKFCNNNQQLKIYQLANFVPLNADKYDVEIEHFRKQMEKAYKLCPKCDSVLKTKIAKQNTWMLGLKIRHAQAKGKASSKQKSPADKNSSETAGFEHALMNVLLLSPVFLLAIFIVTYNINVKQVDLFGMSADFIKNETTEIYGYLLAFFEKPMNRYLSGEMFNETYEVMVEKFMVSKDYLRKSPYSAAAWTGCLMLLFFGFLSIYFLNKTANKKVASNFCHKLSTTNIPQDQYSDEETEANDNWSQLIDDSCDSLDSYNETFGKQSKKLRNESFSSMNQSYNSMPVFGEKAVFENNLNKSLSHVSFSNLSSLNTSFSKDKKRAVIRASVFESKTDLNASLSNLSLDASKTKPLTSQFRNPWTGRYWDGDTGSQSSSQSSGFYSSTGNYNSLPNSRANSYCDDFDCSSLISEPTLNVTKLNRPVLPNKFFSELNCRNNQFSYMNTMYPKYNPKLLFDSRGLYNSSVFLQSTEIFNGNRMRHCFNMNSGHTFEKPNSKSLFNGPR